METFISNFFLYFSFLCLLSFNEYVNGESSRPDVSYKMVFLKISQYTQKNTKPQSLI